MKQTIETRPLKRLRPNPLNPRTIDPKDPEILALAESIRAQGLLQPLVITPDGLIVAGHRRHVACRLAGLADVSCVVKKLDETGQLAAMLAENLQRADLNPVDVGLLCAALRDRSLTADEISQRVGLSKATLAKYLHVADLPPELRQSVASFALTLRHVEALVRLPDPAVRLELGHRAAAESWLAWELEREVSQRIGKRIGRPTGSRAAPTSIASYGARKTSGNDRTDGVPRLIDLLSEATTLINREPALVQDAAIKTWLDRLSEAVRFARGKTA